MKASRHAEAGVWGAQRGWHAPGTSVSVTRFPPSRMQPTVAPPHLCLLVSHSYGEQKLPQRSASLPGPTPPCASFKPLEDVV